ncbi:unnamed protein product, partial [marine sediment metagenome]
DVISSVFWSEEQDREKVPLLPDSKKDCVV